jgi:predicted RNase H-like HicB family nuclease
MKREFNILIEKDEDGYYIGTVSELPGCHTQAKTLDQLNERIIGAIELYLKEMKEELDAPTKFIGIQRVEVSCDKLMIPKQKRAKSSKPWGKDTFLKAGKSTFGE